MLGLPSLDLWVIIGYFAVALSIGYVAMRRVRNQEDYFLGGRGFGKVLQIFGAFGQATSSDTAVGTVTTTYKDGASGIWSQLQLLWSMPILWLTSPWYRRLRVYSMGEYFSERYQSRKLAMIYAVVASFFLVLIIAISLKALSATVRGMTLKPEMVLTSEERAERNDALRLETLEQRAATAVLDVAETAELTRLRGERPRREFSGVNETALVWTVIGIVFVYGLAGGLRGAIWTDVFQGCLIFVLSFLLVPFAIWKLQALLGVEGVTETGAMLHAQLPGRFFSLFGSSESAQFTWYFIVALSVMSTINVAVQANQLTSIAPARDEHTASVGFVTGVFVKRYLTVVWGILGLLCFALYRDQVSDPDLVWGHATRDLLGPVGLGLIGLMIACLLAALQSTASSLTISASTLLTRDVYLPFCPGKSEAHYVLVGRISGGILLIAAAMICTAFDSMLGLMKFLWEFNAIIAASFWCGIKWRGATRRGAWASIALSAVLFILLPVLLPVVVPGLRTAPTVLRETEARTASYSYEATAHDVAERAVLIRDWNETSPPPPALDLGENVEGVSVIAPTAICWSGGIGRSDGQARGEGLFYPEMAVLDRLFDLSGNSYAMNETIRYCYKIFVPFFILIVVSLTGARETSPAVERFFLRMRTKVRADRAQDDAAVAAAYAAPETTLSVLMFPHTRFEFQKWERADFVGVTCCIGGIAVLLLGLVGILSIGGGV